MTTHFGYFEPFWQLLHLRNVFYQSLLKNKTLCLVLFIMEQQTIIIPGRLTMAKKNSLLPWKSWKF